MRLEDALGVTATPTFFYLTTQLAVPLLREVSEHERAGGPAIQTGDASC